MPSGEDDETPERVNPLLVFFAPAAARAFLVFATSIPLSSHEVARRERRRSISRLRLSPNSLRFHADVEQQRRRENR